MQTKYPLVQVVLLISSANCDFSCNRLRGHRRRRDSTWGTRTISYTPSVEFREALSIAETVHDLPSDFVPLRLFYAHEDPIHIK
ncbi:hypothetical protein BDZ89DRAFT_562476 [Hymenopellis radicata]|nr:hypothetical protein BDZ89DRAFT_562476 [Hymenopellis radicata]